MKQIFRILRHQALFFYQLLMNDILLVSTKKILMYSLQTNMKMAFKRCQKSVISAPMFFSSLRIALRSKFRPIFYLTNWNIVTCA